MAESGNESKEHGIKTGDMRTGHDALKMGILCLLNQLTNPQVRGDFLSGLFGPSINPDLLPRLDELRWMVLPRWQGSGFDSNLARYDQAVEHLEKLVNNSEEIVPQPHSSMVQDLTYAEWKITLDMIANDRYWSRVPVEERCAHNYLELTKNRSENPPQDEKNKVKHHHAFPAPKKEAAESLHSSKSGSRKREVREKSNVKIEEITLFSSSQSSATSTDESSGRESYSDKRRSRPKTRKRRSSSDSRSVVTPPKFELDGRSSLSDYLCSYEEYFRNKYRGSDFDKTQMLGQFLTGELLQVFEAKGGRKLKYDRMKEELLSHFKKLKIGKKSFWRKQLETLKPNEDEKWDIFGMRLAKIAELAYPKDKRECASQLRNQFLKRLPDSIVAKITDIERTQKAASGGKEKFLAFSTLAQISKELQATTTRPTSIMWASDAVDNSGATEVAFQRQAFRPPVNRYSSPSPYSSSRQRPASAPRSRTSNYCKRPGHVSANCWRAAKLCLICGGDHSMEMCPQYNPRHRRSPSQQNNQDLN